MTNAQPTAQDARFIESVPELYDRYLGPMLFTPLAQDFAQRLVLSADRAPRVLELAAGTGRLTEQLLARLPAGASLLATDLNAPMVELGRRRVAERPGGAAVEWRAPVDATALPFGGGEFDVVACQLGIMFFPDRLQAAREALRVLRPGGQWIFNVMGSLAENPMGRITQETARRFFAPEPPPFFHVPFSFSDPAALRALAEEAGFARVTVTEVDRIAESPSALDAATGFVRGNPAIVAIREKGIDAEALTNAVAQALAHEFGDHPLRIPLRARVLSAIR